MRLAELNRPFICAVIAEPTCDKAIVEIDKVEKTTGTDAYEVNLSPLKLDSISDVFSCTNKPCIATNRRAEFMKVYGYNALKPINDVQRARRLQRAFELGAQAIDFELDLFGEEHPTNRLLFGSQEERGCAMRRSSSPMEVTNKTEAIIKQRVLVKRIKSSGGETVISCHPQIRIRRDQVTKLAKTIQQRGADFAKIVIMTFEYRDVIETQVTANLLSTKLSIPFNLMNSREYSILGRLLSTLSGSSWIYCRIESEHNYRGQPLVSEAKKFFEKYLTKPNLYMNKSFQKRSRRKTLPDNAHVA